MARQAEANKSGVTKNKINFYIIVIESGGLDQIIWSEFEFFCIIPQLQAY